jgi:signal transduction histidine kinase
MRITTSEYEAVEQAGVDPNQLRAPGFCVFLRLFVRLRWLAVLATLGVIAFFQFVVGSKFNYPVLYALAGLILAYNIVFYALTKRHCPTDETEDRRVSRINALVQINVDLVALFWLLHFSSGLENPCVLFFLFHVVIAGILLKPRYALLEAGVASVLVLGLGLLERFGVLAHYHSTEILGPVELTDSWLFVLGLSAMLIVTMFFLSAFAILIMRERHKQRELTVTLLGDLAEKNEQLLRVDAGRRGLLAVASHDLKSPIAAVAGYLMTLKAGYIGEVSDKQITVLDKCLHRLEGLKDFVSDVLSWTAIESGEMRMAMRPARAERLLEEVVDEYRDRAVEEQITLALSVDPGLPEVQLTPERMLQVFRNLLSNAVKYTLEGGEVDVRAQVSGSGGVLISFRDTGIGMTPEDQKHLFEGFFRASSVKGRFEGTGLGLSLVHGIVGAHDGRIWVESEVNVGSTFYVELPPAQDEEEPLEGPVRPD